MRCVATHLPVWQTGKKVGQYEKNRSSGNKSGHGICFVRRR